MKKQNISSSTITFNDKVVAHHISDESKLISTEIQENTSFDNSQLLNTPLERGYTVDDGVIINNYATEFDFYLAGHPSPEQQKRYLFLGVGAMILITTTLVTAFTLS